VHILLGTIKGYFINGYWCLFYWGLLKDILLMVIGAYFIGDY